MAQNKYLILSLILNTSVTDNKIKLFCSQNSNSLENVKKNDDADFKPVFVSCIKLNSV